VVARGAIRASARILFHERLLHIADSLARIIEEHAPDEAAIEELFHAVNARSALQLAHLRGALVVELARRGVTLFGYSPRAVKMATTGSGAAEKRQVRAMVERITGIRLDEGPYDVSDAIAVAICHAHSRRSPRP